MNSKLIVSAQIEKKNRLEKNHFSFFFVYFGAWSRVPILKVIIDIIETYTTQSRKPFLLFGLNSNICSLFAVTLSVNKSTTTTNRNFNRKINVRKSNKPKINMIVEKVNR